LIVKFLNRQSELLIVVVNYSNRAVAVKDRFLDRLGELPVVVFEERI
jgi:hypothetical protein